MSAHRQINAGTPIRSPEGLSLSGRRSFRTGGGRSNEDNYDEAAAPGAVRCARDLCGPFPAWAREGGGGMLRGRAA